MTRTIFLLDLILILSAGVIVSVLISGGYGFSLFGAGISLHGLRNPTLVFWALFLLRMFAAGELDISLTGPPRRRGGEIGAWLLFAGGYTAYCLWLKVPEVTSRFTLVFLALWAVKVLFNRRGGTIEVRQSPAAAARVVFLFALLLFLAVYRGSAATYGSGFEEGWFRWFDQGYYLKMVRELAGGRLSPENYLYGLGYPLLGAPFSRLYPANPFFIPNCVLFVTTICLYFQIARRLLPLSLALVTTGVIGLGVPLIDFFTVPWNNTISAAGLAVIAYCGVARERVGAGGAILVGVGLGAIFAARYLDAAFILPAAVCVLARGTPSAARRSLLVGLGVAALFIAGTLLVHHHAFGSPWKTPYHLHGPPGATDQNLNAYRPADIPDHLFATLLNPYRFHRLDHQPLNRPLLERSFILTFSLIGLVCLLTSPARARRRFFLMLALGMAAALLWYGSFRSTKALDLRFHSLRYFMMWYPFLALFSVIALDRISQFDRLPAPGRRSLILGGIVTGGAAGLLYLLLRISPPGG